MIKGSLDPLVGEIVTNGVRLAPVFLCQQKTRAETWSEGNETGGSACVDRWGGINERGGETLEKGSETGCQGLISQSQWGLTL